MRRFVRVLVCVALLGLALAGAALAGNGGVAPVAPASPNESGIRSIYWLIMGFTGFIFVVVETALVLFIVRYRSRGRARDVEGPQITGHTNLELAWTAGPVLILAVLAAFVFCKVGGIRNASATPAPRRPSASKAIALLGVRLPERRDLGHARSACR